MRNGEERGSDDDDEDDESEHSEEAEFNLQEEMVFEKSCLNLLNA